MSMFSDVAPVQSDTEDSLCPSESDDDTALRDEIQNDLRTMSFEEIMKLKEQLGAKLYKEAILGAVPVKSQNKTTKNITFKRLNKNRPREASAKKQVPFLGGVKPTKQKSAQGDIRDPRFDKNSGDYCPDKFKENYKFLREIREKEVTELQTKLDATKDEAERKRIKFVMQRLKNKMVEDDRWQVKQDIIKEEKKEIQKAKQEGKTPHYATKKERRAKELVVKFVQLKNTGALSKHLEKKRKKNAAKDRKKLKFD